MINLTEGWLQGFMADKCDETNVSCASGEGGLSIGTIQLFFRRDSPGSCSPLTAGLSGAQAFNQFISGTSFSLVNLVTEETLVRDIVSSMKQIEQSTSQRTLLCLGEVHKFAHTFMARHDAWLIVDRKRRPRVKVIRDNRYRS